MSTAFKVGDRVESVAGDDKGERGFVTELHPTDSCPIWWTADRGATVRCVAERIRLAPPNPPDWIPHCGDRVRVLVKDQKGRSAFIVNTEDPARVFVALLWAKGAVAGAYAPSELELTSAARPGKHERTTPSVCTHQRIDGTPQVGLTCSDCGAGLRIESRSEVQARVAAAPAPSDAQRKCLRCEKPALTARGHCSDACFKAALLEYPKTPRDPVRMGHALDEICGRARVSQDMLGIRDLEKRLDEVYEIAHHAGAVPVDYVAPPSNEARDVYDEAAQPLQIIMSEVDNIARLVAGKANVAKASEAIQRAVERLADTLRAPRLRDFFEGAQPEADEPRTDKTPHDVVAWLDRLMHVSTGVQAEQHNAANTLLRALRDPSWRGPRPDKARSDGDKSLEWRLAHALRLVVNDALQGKLTEGHGVIVNARKMLAEACSDLSEGA